MDFLVTFAVINFVAFSSTRLIARSIASQYESDSATSVAIRELFTPVAVLTWVLTVTSLALSGSVDATGATLSAIGVGDLPGRRFLEWLPTLAATILAVVVAYLGVHPYAIEEGEETVSRREAVGRLMRLVVVGTGSVALVAGLAVVLSNRVPPFATAIVLVPIVTGCWYVFEGIGYGFWLGATEVSVSKRSDSKFDRIPSSLPFDRVFVVDGERRAEIGIFARGPRWNRRVFVTDNVVNAVEDEVLIGFLAIAAGRRRYWCREFHLATAAALLSVASIGPVAIGSGAVPFVPAPLQILLFAATVVGIFALRIVGGRRLAYEADRWAAERTSSETVATTVRWLFDANLTHDSRSLTGRVSMQPPADRRYERLRTAVES